MSFRDGLAIGPDRGPGTTVTDVSQIRGDETMDGNTTNVALPRSSFVGRGADLDRLRAILQSKRLITLTGTGGVGKTRLAREVATSMLDVFPDGVWVVELARLSVLPTEPELALLTVARAVATVLGIREESTNSLITTLATALQTRRALLLLDNCEYARQACAELSQTLLNTCPGLKILATSREALHLEDETVYRVLPLTLPPLSSPPEIGDLTESEAVQLFVARAQSADPSTSITPDKLVAIATIGRRLSGLPLAIELIAPRVKILSVEQIADRLHDVLALARPNDDPESEHHRTLRAALDWSYDLLSSPEATLLRRLAVFAGGCDIDSVGEVCTGEPVGSRYLPDLLEQLVDKSLLVTEENAHNIVRYHLHEVIRQYAWEKLVESSELDVIQCAHAAYFRDFARCAEPELWGARQREWTDRVEADHDNLRAAIAWSDSTEDPIGKEVGLEIATALWWFWFTRGHVVEGRALLESTLASSTEQSLLRARGLYRAGYLAWMQADYPKAQQHARMAEPLCQALGDGLGRVFAQGVLAYVSFARGDFARAGAMGEQILAQMGDLGHSWGQAMAYVGVALCAFHLQRYPEARQLFERALALHEERQDQRGIAEVRNNLGLVARQLGDYAEAAVQHAFSRRLFEELGDLWQLAGVLIDQGTLATRTGDLASARALFRESLTRYQRLGDRRGIAACLEQLAWVGEDSLQSARCLGAARALREHLRLSLPAAERDAHHQAVMTIRGRLGTVEFDQARAEGSVGPLEWVIADALRPAESVPIEGDDALTPREREVATLLGQGLTNREIAERLTISEKTAKLHVSHVLNKLKLENRAQAALWINGLDPFGHQRR